MNQQINNPFIGLRAYKESEGAVFFGRDKQVGELLTSLQTSKLVEITGTAGCGKTSLIQAGLFPALKRGHNGVAGTEWVTCTTRPGRSPIKNLAYALAGNGILDPSVKTTPETSLRIENMMRETNTGIIDAYLSSPIAGKKNLLIFVDQLEDLFQYHNNYADGISENNEQNSYLNNLLRASLTPDAAVYIIFSLRSEFLGDLSQFKRLREEINQRDYFIPRFRTTELKEIITSPLASMGYTASPTAIDLLQKDFGSDLRKLPNLQFLLYKCFENIEKKGSKIIELQDIEAVGGLEQCFSKDLEAHYESLPLDDKASIERIFRSITVISPTKGVRNSEKIQNIGFISSVGKEDLFRLLLPFTTPPRQFLETMPIVITTVDTNIHEVFSESHILSIYNENIFNQWTHLYEWMKSEKESVEMYNRLVGASVRFASGSTGYLRPPDLNLAINWRKEQKPTKAWAKRYNSDFDSAMHYIDASEKSFSDEIAAKENAQKEEIRSYRRRNTIIIIISIAVLLVVSALYLKAKEAHIKAQKEGEIAKLAEKVAEEEKRKAVESARLAQEEKRNADVAKNEALRDKSIALSAQIEATKSKKSAENSRDYAIIEKQAAEESRKNEVAAKEQMTYSLRAEEKAKSEAENRQKMAFAEKEFFVLEHEFERADNLAPLVERLHTAFNDYNNYSNKVFGVVIPNNQLQKLLNQVQSKLQHSNSYADSPMKLLVSKKGGGLRKMAISPNGTIATGGDEGVVYLAAGNKVTSWNIGLRIRTLLFLDEKTLIVGTFTGEVVKVKIEDGTKETLFQYHLRSSNAISNILPGRNAREITVIGPDNIVRLDLDTRKAEQTNIGIPIFASYRKPNSGTTLFSTSEGLYQLPDAGYFELLIDFSAQKSISAIAYVDDTLALGLKSGEIFLYPLDKLFQKSLSSKDFALKFLEHKSEITSFYYEPKSKKMFSASLDNTVKIYDLSLRYGIETCIVTLEGYKQWVWSLGYCAGSQDPDYLLTADEGGNLLKWYTKTDEQIKNIINLQKAK
jgi:WD40 repeat protein